LSSYNFGIHEGYDFPKRLRRSFPVAQKVKGLHFFAQEKPGLGIDIDENLAASSPLIQGTHLDYSWAARE